MTQPDPEAVKATFSSIAPRYDLANHLLSGGIDFYWRRKLVSLAGKEPCPRILDLATGSGDVAFALRKKLPAETEIVGLDFCPPMLERARGKRDRLGLNEEGNQFVEGDCMELRFEDASFDLVTIAFGLRNLSGREQGLREILRVLKPGGRLIVLEFSQPYFWFRPFYYLYLRGILPWVARLLTGDRGAYQYLGTSISGFPDRKELGHEMEAVGYAPVQAHAMTFSIVALHEAKKPN